MGVDVDGVLVSDGPLGLNHGKQMFSVTDGQRSTVERCSSSDRVCSFAKTINRNVGARFITKTRHQMVSREMLGGYVRVSTSDDRQSTDLQREALLSAGFDQRHLYKDRASGSHDARLGLAACLPVIIWVFESSRSWRGGIQ